MAADAGNPLGRLALAAALLAVVVVSLGAYTRLSDAGLGCPDWPGCYGHLTVPRSADDVRRAEAAYPERPVEPAKAWIEMVHRYFAGALGLVIAAIAVLAWRRRAAPAQGVALPTGLLALVVFQALLGMWTVTLLLKPVVVMGHLLGGFTTLLLLWWLALRNTPLVPPGPPAGGWLRGWTVAALAVVYLQVALGGWTAANYAALACTDLPTCHGRWWPEMDFREAFVLWRGLGTDYEFGVLDHPARTAIHVTHRLGAVVTLVVVGGLALAALARAAAPARRAAAVVGLLLLGQAGLGVANVLLSLPLPVAVAHNAGGALLLLALATLLHTLYPRPATPGGMS